MDLFANDIEKIRQDYIRFLGDVVKFSKEDGSTFNGMRRQDPVLDDNLNKFVVDKDNVRMQRPCNGQFTCTFIGASSAGKTTFFRELFPDLNDRGWLETDKNDTTSQGMVIECSENVKDVEIESYTYEDLKHFFEITEEAANEGHVYYTYDDANRTIHVNAEDIIDVKAQSEEKKKQSEEVINSFRFKKSFDLKPFQNFTRDGNNASGVKALTTMEASTTVNTETGNNPLQMRAVVKAIHLSSNFHRIVDLLESKDDKEIVQRIKFIDTPGQGTEGTMPRDEALYYTLREKNRNIFEQLCRDDELDFMVYLCLLGDQSGLNSGLWDKIRPRIDNKTGKTTGIPIDIYRDLEKRLILLVNGTLEFSKGDIKRRAEHPIIGEEKDHIAMYINENILDKFFGASTRPSAICFIECLPAYEHYVNTPEGREIAAQYCNDMLCGMKESMESWTRPDHFAYKTMLNDKLVSEKNGEPFLSNVEHLCVKDDRGHGFFLKTLVDIIKKRGPEMLYQKHIVRSHLEDDVAFIRDYLYAKYNREDGSLMSEQLKLSFDNFVKKYKFREPTGIDDFAKEHFDMAIDEYFSQVFSGVDFENDEKVFSKNIYSWMLDTLKRKIREIANDNVQAESFILKEIDENASRLMERFGYASTQSKADPQKVFKYKYFVKIHFREFLEFLFYRPKSFTDKNTVQTQEDRERVLQLFDQVDSINSNMSSLKQVVMIR